MQDFVPNGTGNSRYLKSISDFLAQYPTYEDMVAALVAGTLPVDFNGVNSAGYTQLGTALSKANLLTDATAADIAALEGTTPTTPNEALDALAAAVSPRTRTQIGSYVGTGTYGSSSPNSLTFSFRPKILLLLGASGLHYSYITNYSNASVSVVGASLHYAIGSLMSLTSSYADGLFVAGGRTYAKFVDSTNTLSWYSTEDSSTSYNLQYNMNNTQYYWVAIG